MLRVSYFLGCNRLLDVRSCFEHRAVATAAAATAAYRQQVRAPHPTFSSTQPLPLSLLWHLRAHTNNAPPPHRAFTPLKTATTTTRGATKDDSRSHLPVLATTIGFCQPLPRHHARDAAGPEPTPCPHTLGALTFFISREIIPLRAIPPNAPVGANRGISWYPRCIPNANTTAEATAGFYQLLRSWAHLT